MFPLSKHGRSTTNKYEIQAPQQKRPAGVQPRTLNLSRLKGQLSQINVSSSSEADSTSLSGMGSQVSTRNLSNSTEDTAIPKLMLGELGQNNLLFRMSSQEHLNMQRRFQRLVSKKGNVQITRRKVSNRKQRYFTDFFNTMLDLKWRFVLIIFTTSFLLSWLAFALIWWIICYYWGDCKYLFTYI